MTTSQLKDALESAQRCLWFDQCNRPATEFVDHPILGSVPCCQRCARFAKSK